MKLPLFANRNYDTDYTLELLLSQLVKSQIKSISCDCHYYNTIVFSMGTLYYWKRNWPYATFSRGTIKVDINNEEHTYNWDGAMPSKKLIKILLSKIDNFIVNND